MKTITKSVSLSGGAQLGLGYFKVAEEVHTDEILFAGKYFGLLSAGAVMGVPILCGYNSREIADMLKSLAGDSYMKKMPHDAISFIKWSTGMRNKFNKSCVKIAKKNLTWRKMRASGRIAPHTKPMVGICKFSDILKTCTTDLFNGKGLSRFLPPVMEIINGKPNEIMKHVNVFYYSDDGVYQWDFQTSTIKKVNNRVVPLWKVYMASFSNSWLTGDVYCLPFENIIPRRAFDGGLFNNHGNLLDDDVVCVACDVFPQHVAQSGLISMNQYTFLLKPPYLQIESLPADHGDNIPFYGFWDERVESEYQQARRWRQDGYFMFNEEDINGRFK